MTGFLAKQAEMSPMYVNLFQLRRSKFFVNTTHTMLKSSNQVLLVAASRNQLYVRYLVLIIDMKIFYEHHANYFWKVGIKCFWAKQAEMSLMSGNLFQSTRSKFFANTTHTMSRKLESSVFGISIPKSA